MTAAHFDPDELWYTCDDLNDPEPCCMSCIEDADEGYADQPVMRLNDKNIWLCCRHTDAAKKAGATWT